MTEQEKKLLAAYEQYSEAIFRHCYFRVLDRDTALDLTQETFIRAFRYVAQGNTIHNSRAFLYRMAHNLMVDFFRKKSAVSLDRMEEKGVVFRDRPRGSLENHIDSNAIIALFDKLDERSRRVLIMRYVDELSPKEIAAIIGENKNAVSVRIHRGLQKVRALWML